MSRMIDPPLDNPQSFHNLIYTALVIICGHFLSSLFSDCSHPMLYMWTNKFFSLNFCSVFWSLMIVYNISHMHSWPYWHSFNMSHHLYFFQCDANRLLLLGILKEIHWSFKWVSSVLVCSITNGLEPKRSCEVTSSQLMFFFSRRVMMTLITDKSYIYRISKMSLLRDCKWIVIYWLESTTLAAWAK